MGLAHAKPLSGQPRPPLPDGPPYGCVHLHAWAGLAFDLPPGDPRLPAIHRGGPASTPPLDNLVGAVAYWEDHPDWMDFLDPEGPSHHDKMVERALYLDRWERWLPPGIRVLDLGGGVGRFSQWLLERSCEVELVDPDLRSLWRAVSMAVGTPGRFDVHWSTGEQLPTLSPFDAAVATEVLCYVEDPQRVIDNLFAALRPGGMLLASVEARWGWGMSADVHPDTVEAWLGDGVVHVPGDRWIRTWEEGDFRALLASRFEVVEVLPTHYAWSGPFEMAAGPAEPAEALALEARLRDHPIAGKLNRAWTAVARRPE